MALGRLRRSNSMTIKKKSTLGRLTLAISAMLGFGVIMYAQVPFAADRPLQKINVAYSSISGNVSPLWVTQDKGFFRKYGLDVQAILIEFGTPTEQVMVGSSSGLQ